MIQFQCITKKYVAITFQCEHAYCTSYYIGQARCVKFSRAAKKMVNQHKVKEKQFKFGDFVTVRIPRIDRTCTDFPRIPCIVVAVQIRVQKAFV